MIAPLAVPDLFTSEECGRIVAVAETGGFAAAGLVRGQQDAGIRRATIAWLDDAGGAHWVMSRLVDAVARANREHFGFTLEDFAERMQVARYGSGDAGHFGWHADIGAGDLAARRKLTVVVQLSDPAGYDGGALETDADGHERAAAPQQGSGHIFPSFVLHRVTPVTRGIRHSLTVWVHGPAFK